MAAPHVIVIGAGSTGAATAYDLAQRGLRVTVLERAGIAGGTTGHNQAQLHSGARYAVHDPDAARECIRENEILRRIMPSGLELNGGYFVGVSDDHLTYLPEFMEACAACAIPARPVPVEGARRLEPYLNPETKAVVEIPDGVFDPYRFCLSFLASACQHGAKVRTFCEVTGIEPARGAVVLRDRRIGQESRLEAEAIINAAGPWAGRVAALAGVQVLLEASAGAMVTVGKRWCQRVLNLLAPPGDGDIIVPQRATSILGTTSWRVEDPDEIPVPPEQVELIFAVSALLVPRVRQAPVRGVMAAARPLLVIPGGGRRAAARPLLAAPGGGGRAASRGFACFDHRDQGAPGFFSIVGGKTSTARLMAEKIADLACRYLGVPAESRTRDYPLASYRQWREQW